MSRVYTSAEQLIGKTPLLELTHVCFHKLTSLYGHGIRHYKNHAIPSGSCNRSETNTKYMRIQMVMWISL